MNFFAKLAELSDGTISELKSTTPPKPVHRL